MRLKIFSHMMALAALSLSLTVPGIAQTEVEPGFNVFSLNQDVEVGRQSAAEVEKQLPMLNDREIQRYVSRVGQRLVEHTPGPDFPYQFKVVNASDINAFALPGGFIYLNRGLLEAAETEGELAGVMAHEISHVALRHGTNQVSKAYLAQAGFGILGGLLGGGTTGEIVNAAGGFGLNALFLKFSRSAEKQADVLGTQILTGAGYDPMDMVSFFEQLREKAGRDPGKVEQFFSSHPAPGDRAERVREEVALLEPAPRRSPVANYNSIRSRLDRLPDPPRQRADAGQGPVRVTIDEPSQRHRSLTDRTGQIRIGYPENWKTFEGSSNFGLTIAPEQGVGQDRNGQQHIVYGVLINEHIYEPERDNGGSSHFHDERDLREGTEELLHLLLRGNSYLDVERRSWRVERIAGRDGLSVVLSGRSPLTGLEERVTVITRHFNEPGRLLYILLIAPDRDYPELRSTFARMVSSLQVRR